MDDLSPPIADTRRPPSGTPRFLQGRPSFIAEPGTDIAPSADTDLSTGPEAVREKANPLQDATKRITDAAAFDAEIEMLRQARQELEARLDSLEERLDVQGPYWQSRTFFFPGAEDATTRPIFEIVRKVAGDAFAARRLLRDLSEKETAVSGMLRDGDPAAGTLEDEIEAATARHHEIVTELAEILSKGEAMLTVSEELMPDD